VRIENLTLLFLLEQIAATAHGKELKLFSFKMALSGMGVSDKALRQRHQPLSD
jgi:hypothetical protein